MAALNRPSRPFLEEFGNRIPAMTRSGRPQGRPRVDVSTPVRVEGRAGWATMRNVSRGGAFVETPTPLPGRREVGIEFKLPESRRSVRSTAQVVWTRPGRAGGAIGQGLRFLRIDRAARAVQAR